MKKILVVLALILFGCTNAQKASFETQTCTVAPAPGGSEISCPDGSSHFIPDGSIGPQGPQGDTGSTGAPGSNGSNGHNSLISTAVADASVCPNGGSVFSIGLDTNDDSVLQLTETTSTAVVCNGINGSNGTNGTNGNNAPPTPFTPVALVEPCASNPNNPSAADLANPNLEIFLKMSSGMLLASVSANVQGLDTHFGVVAPGMTWMSTGIGSNCTFTVDSAGTITRH